MGFLWSKVTLFHIWLRQGAPTVESHLKISTKRQKQMIIQTTNKTNRGLKLTNTHSQTKSLVKYGI